MRTTTTHGPRSRRIAYEPLKIKTIYSSETRRITSRKTQCHVLKEEAFKLKIIF
jgi:hypothetical protein